MKNKLWSVLKPALILTAITAVSAAALAGVNALTADTITRRAEETADRARRQVIDAAAFEAAALPGEDGESYYKALGENGETLGYVFTATVSGKSSGLTVMTGILADGTVAGVVVTEDNETAGYVQKVEKAGLLERLKGLPAAPITAGEDVDTVAQATKTSKGILRGVNEAIERYMQIKEAETDGE